MLFKVQTGQSRQAVKRVMNVHVNVVMRMLSNDFLNTSQIPLVPMEASARVV